MDKFLPYLALILAIWVTYRNIKLIMKARHLRGYSQVSNALLLQQENADELLNKYLEKERDEAYLNKTRILTIWKDVAKDDVIAEINKLEPLKFLNERNAVAINSDSFVWAIMVMHRMHFKYQDQNLDAFYSRWQDLSNLENDLEYVFLKYYYQYLKGNFDKDFFFNINEGNYGTLRHGKHLIGIYKRIAVMISVEEGVKFEEHFVEDLKNFAQSSVGNLLMSDMGILDKYFTLEQETEQ